jgi:nucleoid DNA-binding protein
MNELIQMVVQKTGIPQDKAQMAVDVVLNYLKGKLPSNMQSMVDSAAKGQAPNMGDVQSGLGGMFGKK